MAKGGIGMTRNGSATPPLYDLQAIGKDKLRERKPITRQRGSSIYDLSGTTPAPKSSEQSQTPAK